MSERCPHCSFDPTSLSDYCEKHKPRSATGTQPDFTPTLADLKQWLPFADGSRFIPTVEKAMLAAAPAPASQDDPVDKGPWHVDAAGNGQFFLQSEDFERDARLYINGDFAEPEDERRYAEGIVAKLNAAPRVEAERKWLIWSNEHRSWWAADRCGYRASPLEAGRYTLAEARSICSIRSMEKVPPETMIHEDEALRGPYMKRDEKGGGNA